MNVDSILISEYADVSPQGWLSVFKVFNQIDSLAFPTRVALLCVSLVIHGHPDEAGTEHHAELQLLNAKREVIRAETRLSFRFAGPMRDHPPGLPVRQVLNFRFLNAEFAQPGVYAFEATVDGIYAASVSFLLKQV